MGQIFHRRTNTISKVSISGAVIFLIAFAGFLVTFPQSSYATQVGVIPQQPIPFSHKHHVGDEGIDCRYCHTTVETSPFAGMPSTEICMNCHSQIWKDSPELAPVRDSLKTGQPIVWTRVYQLPGFVYFDHSIHVAKGVACVTCHGQVDQMPLTWKAETLQMGWCVNCHRDPAQFIRPRDQVFNMNWQPPSDIDQLRQRLVVEYQIQSLISCSTCHR